ncbi:hypothetical protein J7K99_01065 [bacterium]|nr:hypothetical protein [bacterium]
MQGGVKSWVLIFLVFGISCAQFEVSDTVVEITVNLDREKCQLPNGFSEGITFISVEDVVYFDVQSFKPDSGIIGSIIDRYGRFLERNPDAVLHLRGYYSPKYDDILSPTKGIELATRRAITVFKLISFRFPAVANRVVIDSAYVYDKPLQDSSSIYDPRVELEILWDGYKIRKFYPRERPPYWRSSYKSIIKDISPVLKKILSNNPDVRAMVVGYGFPPDETGYRWLDYLQDKIVDAVGKNFASQFGLYIADTRYSEKVPYAEVQLVPALLSPGEDSIAWITPPPSCSLDIEISGLPVVPNRIFVSLANYIVLPATEIPTGNDSNIVCNFSDILLIPGGYLLNLYLGEFELSQNQLNFVVDFSDSFSITLSFALKKPVSREDDSNLGASLWYIAGIIRHLAEFDGSGKLTISAKSTSDSLAQAEGERLWGILSRQLCVSTGIKRNKLANWFEKHGIEVEVVPERVANPSEENNFSVIVQFLGHKNK